jgi:hypothetical protein
MRCFRFSGNSIKRQSYRNSRGNLPLSNSDSRLVTDSFHGKPSTVNVKTSTSTYQEQSVKSFKFQFAHRAHNNDPRSGSPNRTLLRLLPGSSHCDWCGSLVNKQKPSTKSPDLSKRLSPGQRRAVCTKGRDVINAS